ncbi:Choline-sulfatase [Pontiella desulfatans]|uniref:Choline-sulfatase n=1 Tax=Pontiella desulfatans TaxID=2750659 RepID=A0A6C2U4L9_PONDE|nr:sulfatase-like hydrolase/transferase [Pontiella desulfatans]SPS73939.1 sulfatase S1_7 [Kiritimatiellales bacterium]VGO14845.1 Choline-sulfatase [Pontiella desulfatans]
MKKRLLLLSVLCVAGVAAAERPNVLFISVDDLNDWVGVFGGHPQCKTPHIDRFAEEAMVFRNASCAGPVCGPSRSALLSGFMPATTGLYGNSNNMLDSEIVQKNTTLPEYFSKNGYLTISRGKIFHHHTTENGSDAGHWAFDVWEKAKGSGKPDPAQLNFRDKGIVNGKKLENPKYTSSGGSGFAFGPLLGGKEGTRDYETARWFGQKLQEDYDKPFFMAVGISKPHLPFHAPQEYFDLYPLESVKVPEFRMDDLDDILDANGKKAFKPHVDFLWCQEYGVMKEAVQAYLATISYADECVGVVLDALAKSKYADNTIVVIWGDHGWHLGEKLKFRKASLWRESTQLPLIIKTPGMKKRQDCMRNVNLIDLYPSLVDLCGLPEKELDGKTIRPLLENPEKEWEPTVTTQGKGNHSVISEKWHYMTYARGFEELYDLENDPMEWTNLVQSNPEKAKAVIAKLKPYLPKHDANEIPKSTQNKSIKQMDVTIKPRRDLMKLK